MPQDVLDGPPNRAAPPLKNAALIYNPTAGGNPARRERQMRQAAEVLEAAGIDAALTPTSAPGMARDLARGAVARGAELILACGGDGTLNEVINGIAPGKVPLGVLPGGTANVFARELGIPLDPVQAARDLAQWAPRRIALGCATWPNGGPTGHSPPARHFLSLAGIGFDAYVIHKLSRSFANAFGVFAYGYEAVRQVLRYRFPLISFRIGDRQIRGTFAVVHRTERYAGWLRLAPGASLFEDRFTFCIFKSPGWQRYLVYGAAIVARQHARLSDVELIQTHRVECSADDSADPVYFELDGEFAGQLPATFEIMPDALTLLAP